MDKNIKINNANLKCRRHAFLIPCKMCKSYNKYLICLKCIDKIRL